MFPSAAAGPSIDALAGTVLDRYAIEAPIGHGGFGTVFRARHTIIGRPVALKVLRPDAPGEAQALERFFQEARAAASIGSPHIAEVYDAGSAPGGWAFLAMELLDGEDLGTFLRRRGAVPAAEATWLLSGVLAALCASHARGIVHRDLKPGNVFVARTGNGPMVKLLDFGVSKMRDVPRLSPLTRTGMVFGTPHYMAPEQFRGARDVDARADLYSAAVILYQLLAGRRPFDADTYEDLVVKVASEPPVPIEQLVRELSPVLAHVVGRGLAKDPDARWQSAGEMARTLSREPTSAPASMYPAPSGALASGYAPAALGSHEQTTAAAQPFHPASMMGAGIATRPVHGSSPPVAAWQPSPMPAAALPTRPEPKMAATERMPRGRSYKLAVAGGAAVVVAGLAIGLVTWAPWEEPQAKAPTPARGGGATTPPKAGAPARGAPAPAALPAGADDPVVAPQRFQFLSESERLSIIRGCAERLAPLLTGQLSTRQDDVVVTGRYGGRPAEIELSVAFGTALMALTARRAVDTGFTAEHEPDAKFTSDRSFVGPHVFIEGDAEDRKKETALFEKLPEKSALIDTLEANGGHTFFQVSSARVALKIPNTIVLRRSAAQPVDRHLRLLEAATISVEKHLP